MKPNKTKHRKRVFIVDDEEQIVLLLKTILNVYSYDSIESLSAMEAFSKIMSDKPDIILLDIAMPDMDGYEVCRQLKNNPKTSHIPIVMITALALEQDRKLAMAAGANGFILKPFDPRKVIDEIERLTSSTT